MRWSQAGLCMVLCALALSGTAEPMDGPSLARAIAARDDGESVRRGLTITLTDAGGRTRSRSAVVLRARRNDLNQTLFAFIEPKSIREAAFLSIETAAGDDRRWLFLPAAGRPRRLPAADRGGYFLGTDFTYADLQSQLKFDLDDYEFTATVDGDTGTAHLAGRTRDAATARELGYGAFEAEVDLDSLIPRTVVFEDPGGRPLKRVSVPEVATVDGTVLAAVIRAENLRTGHSTELRYTDTRFLGKADDYFDPQRLKRGFSLQLP